MTQGEFKDMSIRLLNAETDEEKDSILKECEEIKQRHKEGLEEEPQKNVNNTELE